jgi:hypothetical protein
MEPVLIQLIAQLTVLALARVHLIVLENVMVLQLLMNVASVMVSVLLVQYHIVKVV